MKYYIMDVEVPESIIEKFDDLLYAYLDEDDKLNFAIKEMKSTTIEKTNELLNIIHEIHNKTFIEEDLIKKCEVKVDKILATKECLRCGKEEPYYCETCFQEIIAENARLQLENSKYKQLQINIQGMRSGKTLLQNYIENSILKEEIIKEVSKLFGEYVSKLGSYEKDNSTPEQERIAGVVSFLYKTKRQLEGEI